MAMQKKAWMIFFLFKEFLTFFKKYVLSGVSLTNQHFLVLDGHGNHVILEAIEHAQEFGLEMSTLPFHISHDVQPLNVSCFKQFKTTFGKVKDATMSKSNHMELDKIIMARWVNHAISQASTKKNQGWVQGYKYLALQPQNNGQQDSNFKKITLQQTSTSMEVIKRNTHWMKILITIEVNNGGRNQLLHNFSI